MTHEEQILKIKLAFYNQLIKYFISTMKPTEFLIDIEGLENL